MKNSVWVAIAAFLLCCLPARATVTGTNNSVTYTCSGSVGPYSFTYPAYDVGSLDVIQTVISTNTSTTLPSYDYTTVPVNNSYMNGGSVTLNTACPVGDTLTIQRNTERTQLDVFFNNMPTLYQTFEAGLDKLTMEVQDVESVTATGCVVSGSPGSLLRNNGTNGCNAAAITDNASILAASEPVQITTPGVFTNTQYNFSNVSLVNACSPHTEFQAAQGAQNATDAVTGCILVGGSGSTVWNGNGVAGYCQNSSTTTNCVGVYGQGRGIASGTKNWGGNVLVQDAVGVSVAQNVGMEVDVNTYGTPVNQYGIVLTGNMGSGTVPANAVGFWLTPTTGQYPIGFKCEDAKTTGRCYYVGKATLTAGSASQQIVFRNSDASNNPHDSEIQSDNSGDLQMLPYSGYTQSPAFALQNSTGFFGPTGLLLQSATVATALTNYSCPGSIINGGSFWNGTAGGPDNWGFNCTIDSGINPTSTFILSHTGSSGTTNFHVQTNNIQFDALSGTGERCLHADGGGNVTPASADCGTGGGGGVSSVTGDGSLITNSTSTGAVTLQVGNAAAHRYWGNNTGSSTPGAFVQPSFSDLSGSLACSQQPAFTGDATTSAGYCATSVVKVNGAAVPALASVLGSNSSSQFVADTAHNIITPLGCNDSSGSGTAQSCSTSPTFAPSVGDQIVYKTTTANTGDVTINVNTAGAAHVRKWLGSSTLASGDLAANIPELLTWDGSYWEVYTIGNVPSGGGSGTVSNCSTLGGVAYYAATGTTVSCLTNAVLSAGQLALGVAGTTQGTITLAGSSSGVVTIQPAGAAGTWTWTLPNSGGTANYFMQTNGSGVSTWSQPSFSELSGINSAAAGGTGQNSSAATGVPYVTSGSWAFSNTIPAAGILASGVTATTQTTGDNTTKVATDAFVNASVTAATGFANTALSNLASVAVNLALTPGTDASIALDSASKRYTNGFFSGSIDIGAAGVYGFGAGGTADTGISRDSTGGAGYFDFGNGAANDTTGYIQAQTVHTTGSNGGLSCPEGTGGSLTPSTSVDVMWCDSAGQRLAMNNHNTGKVYVPEVAAAGTPNNCWKVSANGYGLTDAGQPCGIGGGTTIAATTCTMAASTTCPTLTLSSSVSSPVCHATEQGTSATVIAGECYVSGTSVTVTAASSNSAVWNVSVIPGGGFSAAAVAYVNSATPGNCGTVSTTCAATAFSVSTGNAITVGLKYNAACGSDAYTVSDTAGNEYSLISGTSESTNGCTEIVGAPNITGNASDVVTVTFTSGVADKAVYPFQFSGGNASTPFVHGAVGTVNSAASVATASFTANSSSQVVFAFGTPNTGATISAASNYSIKQNLSDSAAEISTASGLTTAGLSSSGSLNWAISAVTVSP
jgi:hypothetical protein